jgi:hypothetical protein
MIMQYYKIKYIKNVLIEVLSFTFRLFILKLINRSEERPHRRSVQLTINL